MASTIGTSPVAGIGTSFMPDLTDTANIQSALKLLYYGTTQLATTNGIYGSLVSLQSQITATQSGVNVHETVKMGTTAVLGTTGNLVGGTITTTYTNGTADASGGTGIGATLTIATNTNWTSITIDGQSLVVGNRVLIKNQTALLQNGIYNVTSVGAVGNTTSFVFTRSEDSNNSIAGEMGEGDFTFIAAGTTNGNTSWILTSTSATGTGPAGAIRIGTDPVSFVQFGSVAFGVQPANTIFAGPTSGTPSAPIFRNINYQDMSTLNTPSIGGQVLRYTAAGTGMAWTDGTLTLPASSSLTLSGGFALTLTQTASTNVTLPTTGTLSTLNGVETLTNKTFASTTISSATTLTVANDFVFLVTSGTAYTVTLPTPTAGKQLTLVRTDATALVITIFGHINGTASTSNTTWFPVSSGNRRVVLVSNGTSWYPIVAGTVV